MVFIGIGKDSMGATIPDRKRYGTRRSLSIALALSLQKQNIENIQCNKNLTAKASIMARIASTREPNFGIQNKFGLIKKKFLI